MCFCFAVQYLHSIDHTASSKHIFCIIIIIIIASLRTEAGGRRKRPNLGLVCCVYILCYLYSLVKMDFDVLLCLV